jgi:hypothetical protein
MDSAMALYLDSIAWEYVLTQSSTAFEALIDKIGWKARKEFAGDASVAEDRQRYWIREAQERARNGIIGLVIPIRVKAHQVQVFHELEHQFGSMTRQKGELQAILLDGARFNIWSSHLDSTDDELHREKFEHLARQAMAALDFRFSDSTRAIFYWLQLLKQKSPLLKGWNTKRLCLASENFCRELKTRAQESTALEREEENTQGSIPPSGQSDPKSTAKRVPATRGEIESFAQDKFAVARDHLTEGLPAKQRQVLNQVRSTGNSGGYAPAYIKLATESVRGMIIALADAYVEAFDTCGAPSDIQAERTLQKSAEQFAAGSISAISGQAQLHSLRIRIPDRPIPGLHSAVKVAVSSAMREGLMRLKEQRLKFKTHPTPLPPSTAEGTTELAPPAAAKKDAQPPANDSTQVLTVKRKRGRPQKISDEKKLAAAKLKTDGGTNKEIAAVIYGTKHPSDQQRKNVSAILRHYGKKAAQLKTKFPSPKDGLKPNKTKG